MNKKIDTMGIEQEIIEQNIVEKKLAKAEKKTAEKKKGQSVNWKPASRLPKLTTPEGYVARWVHNTPDRIRQMQSEQWEIANRFEHKMDVEMGEYYKKINDKPASETESTIIHNELIAMIMPEETAEARKEYYRQETEQQTRSRLVPERKVSGFLQKANITTTMEIN